MAPAPIILVPGFWLGAWAWDDVAGRLRDEGHSVHALTLPGLEAGASDADRAAVHFADHVDAIVAAVEAAPGKPVLVVHSAAGFTGYAASDRIPDGIAAMVYVDTAPGKGALDPSHDGDKPLVWEEIEAEENLTDLTPEHIATFRERAVTVPGNLLREAHEFTNDARNDIPSTLIATGFSSDDYRSYAKAHPDWAFLAGLLELRNVTYIDLPTSHWPMWSKPDELASIIGRVATEHAS